MHVAANMLLFLLTLSAMKSSYSLVTCFWWFWMPFSLLKCTQLHKASHPGCHSATLFITDLDGKRLPGYFVLGFAFMVFLESVKMCHRRIRKEDKEKTERGAIINTNTKSEIALDMYTICLHSVSVLVLCVLYHLIFAQLRLNKVPFATNVSRRCRFGGKGCSVLHLTAVWETGSRWVGQVWGEYSESAGWKAPLLNRPLISLILFKLSQRRAKSEDQLTKCLFPPCFRQFPCQLYLLKTSAATDFAYIMSISIHVQATVQWQTSEKISVTFK